MNVDISSHTETELCIALTGAHCSTMPLKTRLDGVPVSVPIPPQLAAYATQRNSGGRSCSAVRTDGAFLKHGSNTRTYAWLCFDYMAGNLLLRIIPVRQKLLRIFLTLG